MKRSRSGTRKQRNCKDGVFVTKKLKRVIIGVSCATVAAAAWIAFCGYQWSWGPFSKLHDLKTANLPGNAAQYAPDMIGITDSPLAGKHIIFLGSSVTYGSAAGGVSFADYIAARNVCTVTKEAVSGTTLVESGLNSYITRLKKLGTETPADLFVCQLSTNDATQNKPLGSISDSVDLTDFDTSTVAGAIEYVIAYAKQTWNCPVVFYTNPQYSSENYAAMVELLTKIANKWGISVIDMWNDVDFNVITEEQRSLYMADDIHPTRAGYLEWWTPYMENVLFEVVQ